MPARHLEKVQAHARKALAPEPDQAQADLIKQYRSFLKKEEHRIRLHHKSGASGLDIAAQRSTLLDVVLHNLFAGALAKSEADIRISLVATGGYGRGLLNPGSDVDLLFLHPERGGREISGRTREVIEKVLYMLWDVGFKIGHAVRTLKETYAQANADHQTKTALLDCRFITGDCALFDEFNKGFPKQCINGKAKDFLAFRAEDLRDRHNKQSNTVYLQEPHLKNGCGGLRDYHNILWCCQVKLGLRDMADLIRSKVFSPIAGQEIIKAHDFLLRVRNDLHYSEKRASDLLTLRSQGVVATNLKYPGRRIVQRCETFMRDFYHHARNIYQHNLSLMERFELERVEEKDGIFSFLALRKGPKREKFDGFFSRDGFIFPEDDNIFLEDSTRMMRLFQHCQLRRLKLSPQMRQLFKAHYGLINRTFRYRKANRETFEAILCRKGEVGATLRQMHRVGFLGRYLPEFGELTDLVQHEFFHRYTADEHTLKCLECLDALTDNKDPKRAFHQKLFHDLDDPFVLYAALIMHDTGRAENVRKHAYASTELADAVCRRLQVPDQQRNKLLFLVDNHLLFWHTATTRNLEDPEVIAGFAKIVRRREWLDALFLHTYADSRATNEAGWTDWKESLVRQLYKATAAYFSDQEGFRSTQPPAEQRHATLALLDESYGEELDAHFAGMPERYLAHRTPTSIARHLKAFRAFYRQLRKDDRASALTPFLKWTARPEQGSSELILCTWDRHQLLSKIAGALAANSLNILRADFFLRADQLVLDVFRVCTTDFEPVTNEKQIKAVGELIARACSGEVIDYAAIISKRIKVEPEPLPGWRSEFPMRVYLTNEQAQNYTIVEIQAVDRIGLLFQIFETIGKYNLEITHARINTEKGAAIDSFCLTGPDGKKITDSALLQRLKADLEKACLIPA